MLTKACTGLTQYTLIWKGFLNEKFCTEWFVHSIAQAEKPTYHFCTTLYYITTFILLTTCKQIQMILFFF